MVAPQWACDKCFWAAAQAIPDSPGFRVPWFGRSRGKGGPAPGGRGRRGRGGGFDRGGRRGMRRAWSGSIASEHYVEDHDEGLSVEDIVAMCQQLPPGKQVCTSRAPVTVIHPAYYFLVNPLSLAADGEVPSCA